MLTEFYGFRLSRAAVDILRSVGVIGLFLAVSILRSAYAAEPESYTPREALARAKAAALTQKERFQSAQVIGRFETWFTLPGEPQPTLAAEGKFVGVHANGKYRVDFEFISNRRLSVRQKAQGLIIGLAERDVELKSTVISAGDDHQLIEFYGGRLHSKLHSGFSNACNLTGFPFPNPFLLNTEIDRGPLNETITMEAVGKEFVGRCDFMDGGSRVVVVDPTNGFHVNKFQLLEVNGRPTYELHAKWKKVEGVWVVRHLTKTCNVDVGIVQQASITERSECTILSFRPNVEVDPAVFSQDAPAKSLDPLPFEETN